MTNAYLHPQQIIHLRLAGYEVAEVREVESGRTLCRISLYALEALEAPELTDRTISGLILDAAALRLHIR